MTYQVYVGVIVFFLVNVQKGHAIKCYSCSSKDDEACYRPDLSQLTPVQCGMKTLGETRDKAEGINRSYHAIFDVDQASNVGVHDLVCLKVIVKDGNKDYVLRGCQLAEQQHLDICKRLQDSNTNTIRKVFCSKCSNEDGCNSSPKTFSNNILLALVCSIVVKKFYTV
ncbi:hypothetical protein NQ317_013304 [Molorchus minor]|uniref:Protein sleepless n=1 Tax=Molorchus minor TaxID=1323400 RepID=A0ABQ9JH77_9CUCU|nr:hypothetical protein NQ317_013304 [Molorchus minor]